VREVIQFDWPCPISKSYFQNQFHTDRTAICSEAKWISLCFVNFAQTILSTARLPPHRTTSSERFQDIDKLHSPQTSYTTHYIRYTSTTNTTHPPLHTRFSRAAFLRRHSLAEFCLFGNFRYKPNLSFRPEEVLTHPRPPGQNSIASAEGIHCFLSMLEPDGQNHHGELNFLSLTSVTHCKPTRGSASTEQATISLIKDPSSPNL